MPKGTVVVSAFPACGKSFMSEGLCKDPNLKDLVYADSDSSQFGWITVDGERVRNPDFIRDYMDHIKSLIGKVDVIFVSSHEPVRKALDAEGISWCYVVPSILLKEEWVGRMYLRGSDKKMIDFIANEWGDLVYFVPGDHEFCCASTTLQAGEYLADKMRWLILQRKNYLG